MYSAKWKNTSHNGTYFMITFIKYLASKAKVQGQKTDL
jgi:hypothetical protein